MLNNNLPDGKFDGAYLSIKEVIERARNTAYRAVNFAMVQAYWSIGRVIVEDEQKGEKRAEYGKALIKDLSKRLTKDYGIGFNERNLWHMKDFYLTFPNVNALRSELTWTHYRLLLRTYTFKSIIIYKDLYLNMYKTSKNGN